MTITLAVLCDTLVVCAWCHPLGHLARMTVTLAVPRVLAVRGPRTSICDWVPPSQAPSHDGSSLLLFLRDRRCLCALV